MNPEIESRLVTVLDYIGEAVKNNEYQIPEIAQEIVNRALVTSCMMGVVFFVLSFGCIALARWALVEAGKKNGENDDFTAGFFVVSLLFLLLFSSLGLMSVYDFASVYVAPRVYVLEWVAARAK
jgi:hypothetical protein